MGSDAGKPEGADPEITVIVVNYNGGDWIARCMASLSRQTHRNFETILVDNASSDNSFDRITEQPARLTILREPKNHGFARGNNIAARMAKGKWIALLNPDAEAAPDWLESLMRAVASRPSHRVVASLQIATQDANILDGAGDCYLAYGYAWRGGFGRPVSDTPQAGECFAPCGAAALYPRDVFLEAGGFDERYFCYHEDVDLGFRLRLLGERCQFDPLSKVRHAGSALTGRTSDFAVFHGARNGLWTYVKNMPGRLLWITAPVWFLGTLAILARGLMTGRFNATLRGLTAAVADLGPALAARRDLKARRRASAADIAASLSWNPFRFLARKPDIHPFRDTTGD
ncbi:MAG TPA: glycosyltransferase family 2 protein [Hyphomonadaceae bacterium]|jgi:GT2 family glycosyltransferase|nr:glycosyltransferase family 2 protein [Hyphomonadaceae bacterium]